MAAPRAIQVAGHLARASVLSQMQYRWDFVLQIVMAGFWVAWNVAPVLVVFSIRPQIASFGLPEAMLVISAFMILRAVLEGVINPNMVEVVEQIRSGKLDFVLLKPVDSQLLVSTTKLAPTKLVDLSAGAAISVWSVLQLDPTPPATALLAGLLMLGAGLVVLYSIWMLVLCSAFWLVRIDNLAFLFTSIFDAGRWPITVFRGWVRWVLTFVLPIALMTTYPALAVLGRLTPSAGLTAAAVSIGFFFTSRGAWKAALLHYSSASS